MARWASRPRHDNTVAEQHFTLEPEWPVVSVLIQIGSGLLESVSQVAVLAGAVVLGGMVVALVVFAYKSLAGDGIEWPDDEEDPEGVSVGSEDDEWKYY